METSLKERVLRYIRETDYVSFAELSHRFEGFTGGDRCSEIQPNLIIWTGMNIEASAAISELLNSGDIFCATAGLLIYLVDGCCLKLPVAKRLKPYKKTHWLPVTLRPAGAGHSRKARAKADGLTISPAIPVLD